MSFKIALSFCFALTQSFAQSVNSVKFLHVKLDSLKYPQYNQIHLEPLWSREIDNWYSASSYALIFSDTMLVTNKNFLLDVRTGEVIRRNEQSANTLSADFRIITSSAGKISILDPTRLNFITLAENDGISRKPQLLRDSILFFPTMFGLAAYDVLRQQKVWDINQDFRLTYDNFTPNEEGVIASRTYFYATTDSISHSVVKISKKGIMSPAITIKNRILQLFTVKDKLAIVCEKEIFFVEIRTWEISSKFRFDRSQSFVLLNDKLISPNMVISLSTGEIVQASTTSWSNDPITIWNGWLVLNFDDGEITRQFLVSEDRSKVFQLDYDAKDFKPCQLEGFGDQAILKFIESNGTHTVAICQCDNGFFLYGFKFPDLPTK